jgi:translocation and assembly module TamB
VKVTGNALLRTGQSRYDISLALDELARILPEISGPVSLTSAGTETDLGWDATLEATGPRATRLSATATTRQSLINARIDAVTQGLSDLFPDLTGNSALQADISQTAEGWRFQTSGTGPAGTSLESSGTLSEDFATGALVASGDFPLAALNRTLKPNAIQGTAAFDLALDGALSPENLSGTVRTNGARLSLPDIQMALNNLRSQITLANGTADLSVDGDVAAGGAISVRGNTTLSAPFNGNISTSLQAVRVKFETLAETILNGEVTLSGPLTGGALIAGDILLDPTEIRVSTTGGSGSAGTAITHIGEPASVRRTRDRAGVIASSSGGASRPFDLNLTISAPNRFFVRGLGLDSEFGGAVTLTGTTANPIASGEFELLRGRLNFLARRFDLTEGLVTLAGSFTPDIRLVASTESADATFDIILEGSADAPEISITSSPEMAEDEAHAQLLFGSSASEISPLQAARLANAVASMSGGGGSNLFGGLRNSVGIDDLDVSTDANGQTEVTAGKYINDNIYSEIGIDGEGNSSISLNLDVTRNLTVRGQVGAEANTGIGRFFQKDY